MWQLTWNDVDKFISELSIHYRDWEFTGVYGIPRGGSVLAVMVSHALNIPCLFAPCKGCLVVDDISDSGLTLLHFREKGYEIATMFCKKETVVVPNFYTGTKTDEWIVFPWEKVKKK